MILCDASVIQFAGRVGRRSVIGRQNESLIDFGQYFAREYAGSLLSPLKWSFRDLEFTITITYLVDVISDEHRTIRMIAFACSYSVNV